MRNRECGDICLQQIWNWRCSIWWIPLNLGILGLLLRNPFLGVQILLNYFSSKTMYNFTMFKKIVCKNHSFNNNNIFLINILRKFVVFLFDWYNICGLNLIHNKLWRCGLIKCIKMQVIVQRSVKFSRRRVDHAYRTYYYRSCLESSTNRYYDSWWQFVCN